MTDEIPQITRTEFVQPCALCGVRMSPPSDTQISVLLLPERAVSIFNAHLECISGVLAAGHRESFDRWRAEHRRGRRA